MDEQIHTYKECLQQPNEYHSFQTFTSTSRNRIVAEFLGMNALFIIRVKCAFTADLQPYSQMPAEEEELINPGICFTVEQVEFDEATNKHLIYVELQQRFNSMHNNSVFFFKLSWCLESAVQEISNHEEQASTNWLSTLYHQFNEHLCDADFTGVMGFLFNRRDNSRHLRRYNRDGLNQTDPFAIFIPSQHHNDDDHNDDE
jgi:hypothetical protein